MNFFTSLPKIFPGYKYNEFSELRWQISVWVLIISGLLSGIPIAFHGYLTNQFGYENVIYQVCFFALFSIVSLLYFKMVSKIIIRCKEAGKSGLSPLLYVPVYGPPFLPASLVFLSPAFFANDLGIFPAEAIIFTLPACLISFFWIVKPIVAAFE